MEIYVHYSSKYIKNISWVSRKLQEKMDIQTDGRTDGRTITFFAYLIVPAVIEIAIAVCIITLYIYIYMIYKFRQNRCCYT